MNAASPVADADTRQVTNESRFSGRGLVIMASILSAVGAAVLSLFGQYFASLWEDQRHQRVQEVTSFVEESQKFDVLVSNYMTQILAGHDASKERAALHENIQRQYNLLETAKANLNERGSHRATEYQRELASVGEQLDRNLAAQDAKPLWLAIHEAKLTNVCVVYSLRQRAKLPTVVTDKVRCESPK